MKIICAYLLASLSGNSSPCSADLKKILSSVGIEPDEEKLELFMRQVAGKSIEQVIACGRQMLEQVPFGGGGGVSKSAKEEKNVEKYVQRYSEKMASRVVTEAPNKYRTLRVTPLVEIYAVTIHSEDEDDCSSLKSCEIHGEINILEEDEVAFNIFDEQEDKPASINLGQSLLLTPDANDSTIIPSKHVRLKFELYDRARCNVVVAKGDIELVKTTETEDWLEDYQEKRLPGGNGVLFAKVHYCIFPYAVPATVKVFFFNKDDHFDILPCNEKIWYEDGYIYRKESSDLQDLTSYEENHTYPATNLYGTVSASTGLTGNNDGKISITSSLLLSKSRTDFVKVKSRGVIKLSRSMVVVPAYSSLVIEVAFYDTDTQSLVSSGILEFKPDSGLYKKDITGVNGSRIRVQVSWSDAYKTFFHVCGLNGSSPTTSEISDTESGDSENRQEHFSSSASDDDRIPSFDYLYDIPPSGDQEPLMELFSVVVCSKDGTPLKFYGEVIVDDGTLYFIFNKNKSVPQDCPKLGTLAILEGPPRSFSAMGQLSIVVDLKDVAERVFSSGCVFFSYDFDIFKVANKRMCTVVRGDSGFAALHYSFFPDGVSGHVVVELHSNRLPCTLKGKIYARHVMCDEPPISYQEKLFSSILFHNVEDGVSFDTNGSTLALARSVITLPRESNLIIEADLTVGSESLKGETRFSCSSDAPVKIGKDDLYLMVSVKFKGAIFNP